MILTYPELLYEEIHKAVSFFPELNKTALHFHLTGKMHSITMKAQPSFISLFKRRSKRTYHIYISKTFKNASKKMTISDLPSDVLIGWIGHELGHIMDYEQMTNWQLMKFGFNYLVFDEHYNESEHTADFYAVRYGMEEFLIKKRKYILEHPDIFEGYKKKFKDHYLSPDDLLHLVKCRDV